MPNILIDMNYKNFQDELLDLEKIEQTAFLKTCKKIRKMNWEMIYKDKGLNWEEITSKKTKSGDKIFSIRFSKKYRAVVLRKNDYLVFISIHVDHDSTYE